MTTSTTFAYTIDAGNLVFTDTGRTIGLPTEIASDDLRRRDPVAWAAIHEFMGPLAVTSGTVTITAA